MPLRNNFHVTRHWLRKAPGSADWVKLVGYRYRIDAEVLESLPFRRAMLRELDAEPDEKTGSLALGLQGRGRAVARSAGRVSGPACTPARLPVLLPHSAESGARSVH